MLFISITTTILSILAILGWIINETEKERRIMVHEINSLKENI